MPTNAEYFPPKTKANHNSTPPLLLRLTNPLCMVVCQPPQVGLGEHYFLMKYGEEVSASLGCSWVLYYTNWANNATLPQARTQKTQKTHDNQHDQAPPYPPAASVLSLHGNIRHGPISWRRRSLWVLSWRGAFGVLLLLPVPSIGASK